MGSQEDVEQAVRAAATSVLCAMGRKLKDHFKGQTMTIFQRSALEKHGDKTVLEFIQGTDRQLTDSRHDQEFDRLIDVGEPGAQMVVLRSIYDLTD